MKVIRAYTDGSSNGKSGGTGGWGVYFELVDKSALDKNGNPKILHSDTYYGHETPATNNSMELTAIKMAMDSVKSFKYPVEIISDSMYAIDSITKWVYGWRKKGSLESRTNGELIDKANKIYEKLKSKTKLDIIWVKGHNGNHGNERVDELAVNARKQQISKLP